MPGKPSNKSSKATSMRCASRSSSLSSSVSSISEAEAACPQLIGSLLNIGPEQGVILSAQGQSYTGTLDLKPVREGKRFVVLIDPVNLNFISVSAIDALTVTGSFKKESSSLTTSASSETGASVFGKLLQKLHHQKTAIEIQANGSFSVGNIVQVCAKFVELSHAAGQTTVPLDQITAVIVARCTQKPLHSAPKKSKDSKKPKPEHTKHAKSKPFEEF